MTDAEKYALVFRAAGDGLVKPYEVKWDDAKSFSIEIVPGPRYEAEQAAREKANMFYGIAELFEKIAEAERKDGGFTYWNEKAGDKGEG